jgi:predicted dehydrogenase
MRKNVIIMGSGSYVLGDSFGKGVILPALLYLQKLGKIENIYFAVRSNRNKKFYDEIEMYKKLLNTNYDPEVIVYNTVEEIEKIDLDHTLAFIAIPDNFHFEAASFFIKRKVPIWIVKPLTGDFESSKELCDLAFANKTKIWVDYHKRFDPSNLKIKEAIDSGTYGDLSFYSVQYSQPSILPLFDLKLWANDINVLQYIGCHYIDQIFFLFPEASIKRLSCTGIEGGLIKKGGPKFDTIHCIIDFVSPEEKLIKLDLNVSWSDPKCSPGKSHQRVDLQFENGRIIADQKNRGMEIWGDNRYDQVNPNFFQFFKNPFIEDYSPRGYGFESIENFIDILSNPMSNIIENSKLFPWAFNCIKTDFALSLAQKSLNENGNWVNNL